MHPDPHLPAAQFQTGAIPTWCPGCGNFALWTTLNRVFSSLKLEPHQVIVVFDIGCAGNGSNWIRAYTFHGLHGRSIPLATGVALANHRLKTIAIMGDGAAYGEGLGHFLHAIRANPDITLIVEDNQLYALTKGQTSPTTSRGAKTDSAPSGVIDEPLNPVALAIASNCSFVARGFAGDLTQLESLMTAAINHRGFAFIDVFQPCVTFNHLNTYLWFYEHVSKLESVGHDPHDRLAALHQALEPGETLPTGLFFEQPRPTLQEQLPVLKDRPLVDRPVEPIDLSDLYRQFA